MSILDEIGREDIEEYMEYLSLYIRDGQEITNNERGKARKLASLRSFYHYYFCSELIKNDTAALVPMPKLHEKELSGWILMKWRSCWIRLRMAPV